MYGTQIDQVLADETPTGMVWALADRLGTVSDLVDNNGVVVNHVTYDSFGKIQSQSNTGVGFRYGYTGREQDGETGLDYYRARYYDAGNGRFISEDPIGFRGGDGNLTRYVRNNAVNKIDPSGLITFAVPGGFGEFRNLLPNLFLRIRRYGVYPLPQFAPLALPAARALLETIGENEPIVIIAHSDGNATVLPFLVPFLKATKPSNQDHCKPLSKHEIYVGRLDPTGVPKFIGAPGADVIVDVGSNNPDSSPFRNVTDWASLKFLNPDFRAKKGVTHNGLLDDREVLNTLQFRYGFPF